jgi:hypothetical protein
LHWRLGWPLSRRKITAPSLCRYVGIPRSNNSIFPRRCRSLCRPPSTSTTVANRDSVGQISHTGLFTMALMPSPAKASGSAIEAPRVDTEHAGSPCHCLRVAGAPAKKAYARPHHIDKHRPYLPLICTEYPHYTPFSSSPVRRWGKRSESGSPCWLSTEV